MWILCALTASVILASRKVSEKHFVGSAGNALGWMIRLGSAITILVLWIIFSRDTTGMMSPVVWGVIVLISIVIYPFYTFGYYYAVKNLPFSYFGMLGIIAPVANTVFSYFFFGTLPTLAGYIGIMSILIGLTVLLYRNEHREIPLAAFIIAVLVYMSMGFNPILDKIAMSHSDPFTYAMLNQLAAIIPVFLMSYIMTGETKFDFLQKNFYLITLIGLSQGIGWLGSVYAFSSALNIGYAVTLINTHAILTTLYGTIVLKEKMTRKKLFVFICMFIALISFVFA